MTNLRAKIIQLGQQEKALSDALILAPVTKHSRVVTRIGSLTYKFRPKPGGYRGWGIWRPESAIFARFQREARADERAAYLDRWDLARVWLVAPLDRQTWLGYPWRESIFVRFGFEDNSPLIIHLVEDGEVLQRVNARWDGVNFWYAGPDATVDPREARALQDAFARGDLSVETASPEARAAFGLVIARDQEYKKKNTQAQLEQALAFTGAKLVSYVQQADRLYVQWESSRGFRGTSLVSQNEMTIAAAGLCLSGGDSMFDLTSLPAVVDRIRRPNVTPIRMPTGDLAQNHVTPPLDDDDHDPYDYDPYDDD